MKIFSKLLLVAIAGMLSVHAEPQFEIFAGPHFNYTRLHFNNPSCLGGYQGGVTAGAGFRSHGCFALFDFEGTWNAGPITGSPCQRSDLTEYFLELKVGRDFCCWCCTQIQPYFGFGWDRFENRQDPRAANLLYRYDKLFVPLGVFLNWRLWDCHGAVQLEWRPDVWSKLRFVSRNLNPDWGCGFRVQVPLDMGCGCWWIEVVPFFDWNWFGEVREVNSSGAALVIPHLVRWSSGLRLLAGCRF